MGSSSMFVIQCITPAPYITHPHKKLSRSPCLALQHLVLLPPHVMATFDPSHPLYNPEPLNHFHEYTEDIEELFEVRELTPPLVPRKREQPPAPRVGVFKKVLAKVRRKKIIKPLTPPPEEEEEDWNKYGELPGGRAGTFPRMTKAEREAQLQDMRDEMYEQGKYARVRALFMSFRLIF